MNIRYEVTLATLRQASACFNGYNRLVRAVQGLPFTEADAGRQSYLGCRHEAPVSLACIAQSNGLEDAIWSLRCIPGCERDARLFAIWCARQVEHLTGGGAGLLDVAERFANGKATKEELAAARITAVRSAARTYAAIAAAIAAATVTYAADTAARTYAARAYAAIAIATATAATAAAATAAADYDCSVGYSTVRKVQAEMFIAVCEGRAPWQQGKQGKQG